MGRHDDEHLRRFVAARKAGDADAMRRWWEELVITLYSRIDGIVAATHKLRLSDAEHDDAVLLSMSRVSEDLVATFNGTSMGELVNATKRIAYFSCIDVQRTSMKRRDTVPLDGGWDADGEDAPPAQWEAEAAAARFRQDQHDADMEAFLGWAMPQLPARQREVVDLTFYGAEVSEIAERLGITDVNVYKLRSRGLKLLAKLLRDYEDPS